MCVSNERMIRRQRTCDGIRIREARCAMVSSKTDPNAPLCTALHDFQDEAYIFERSGIGFWRDFGRAEWAHL